MVNSRNKGVSAEKDFTYLLRRVGFKSARRGQQHKGTKDSPDIIVDELPHIHFEVKWVEGMDIHTKLLEDAMAQSSAECGDDQVPVVAWKYNRVPWRLTWGQWSIGTWTMNTTTGDKQISAVLRLLNKGRSDE